MKEKDVNSKLIQFINENRFRVDTLKGDLFRIFTDKSLEPLKLIKIIDKNYKKIKIYIFLMYESDDDDCPMYHCIDGIKGDKFYINITKDGFRVNLCHAEADVLARLVLNLNKILKKRVVIKANGREFQSFRT